MTHASELLSIDSSYGSLVIYCLSYMKHGGYAEFVEAVEVRLIGKSS